MHVHHVHGSTPGTPNITIDFIQNTVSAVQALVSTGNPIPHFDQSVGLYMHTKICNLAAVNASGFIADSHCAINLGSPWYW